MLRLFLQIQTLLLVNGGHVSAPNDTVTANNSAQITVLATPEFVPFENYDLALTLAADKDTVDTEADTLNYVLVITNLGPNSAFGITLTDTLPPFVSAFEFSEAPSLIQGDMLHWQINSLAVDSSLTVSFSASVDVIPPDTTLLLVNRGYVSAPNDTITTNNFAQATVVATSQAPAIFLH